MAKKYWVCSIVGIALVCSALDRACSASIAIGIALPQGKGIQSAEAADQLRRNLMAQIQSHSIEAMPLAAAAGDPAGAEAQSKHLNYILYTSLDQKHSVGGFLSRLAPLAGALPFGALAGKGGVGGMAGAAMQGATNMAASQMTGAVQSNVKRGDTLTLNYRLVAVGSSNPLASASYSGKADGDGQDVVSPLVAQLGEAVSAAAQGGSPAQASGNASSTAGDAPPAKSGSSLLGGLFGHRKSSRPTPTNGAMNGGMDCAQMANMPNAPMTVEACQKLQAVQQGYNQAASDPSAQRPGDEQMTCPQIAAELRQQQYTAPDKTKAAALNATATEQQQNIHKEYANLLKQKAEDQAAVGAATAADNATEAATAGMVRGRSLDTVEKAIDARNQANNERILKETQPNEQKMIGQMADMGSGLTQQLQSNPRLAHLMQLATAKHCKGS